MVHTEWRPPSRASPSTPRPPNSPPDRTRYSRPTAALTIARTQGLICVVSLLHSI